MKAHRQLLVKCMVPVVAFTLCGLPEIAQAQEPSPSQQSGTSVDPSKGPLEPIPTQNLPNSPGAERPAENPDMTQTPQPATPAPQPKAAPFQEPLGTATAEGVATVGGGASRPAGAAIAPAKQNQRRSLLIKLGAIAAVGVASGTIYALSKGTSSKP